MNTAINTKKTAAVIGAGISGLAAAAVLARQGVEVSILEKNEQAGGRLRHFEQQSFRFDMGPSWYWMPDVFERFYNRFGHTAADFYELKKLDPGFQVIEAGGETMKVPTDWDGLLELFENIEKGAADRLKKFMAGAEYKYRVGMENLVYQPGLSLAELIIPATVKGLFRLQLFTAFSRHVRRYFKNERLVRLMEFPVLFLGAKPEKTPALYSLMNYAGLKQGTFYPQGGFGKIVEAFVQIAREQGASLSLADGVKSIRQSGIDFQLQTEKQFISVNGLIASADYHHVDTQLLQPGQRNYTDRYWQSRVMAPSCLLFYLGINQKVAKLEHHNLFFDADFAAHASAIYDQPGWPQKPLFYVCCPSKTDSSVAPDGQENLFVLMPIAPGLPDDETTRQHYYHLLMDRLEKYTGQPLRSQVVVNRSYCVSDFVADYHAYRGNAYGLANTLRQTANWKPSLRNRHLPGMYYAGQLTVPGPGVPPAIVSGQVAAGQLIHYFSKKG